MKLKRMMTLLLAAAFCLAAVPAGATQYVQPGAVYIPGQLTVDEVWAAGPIVPMQQMQGAVDGYPYTSWNASAGGAEWLTQNYLMASFRQGAAVSSLWVRAGDYSGAAAYYSSGRPITINVQLWLGSSGSYTNLIEYDYAVRDEYKPDSYESGWYCGYQQLVLPETVQNVQSIVIRVKEYVPGTYSRDVLISDIAVCGPSYTYPTVTQPPSYTYPTTTQPPYGYGYPVTGVLLQKIATRSGPSTRYTEPGTFLSKGDTVEVISLAYDNNDVPWVQVDFYAYGGHRRAYTGLKRIDLEAWQIPEEQPLNRSGYVRQQVTPRTGPGSDYMSCKDVTLVSGDAVFVMAEENGWLQVEFTIDNGQQMRAWVQAKYVSW